MQSIDASVCKPVYEVRLAGKRHQTDWNSATYEQVTLLFRVFLDGSNGRNNLFHRVNKSEDGCEIAL